jgi:hypothetical protein
MQIFVRTLDDRTLTFDVQSDDYINDVKELIEQREGKQTKSSLNRMNLGIFRYSGR